MTDADFRKYYKTISLGELLDIVDNPDRYEPEAVGAARQELETRQLSEEMISEARQPALDKQLQKDSAREKRKALEGKMRGAAQELLGIVSPVQPATKTTEKIIKSLAALYILMGIIAVIDEHRSIHSAIKDLFKYPLYAFSVLAPLIMIFVSAIPFWNKRPVGWPLLTGTIVFLILVIASLLWQSLRWSFSGIGHFKDNLFSMPSPWRYIGELIVPSASLYVICKPQIREVFIISKEKMWKSITVGALAWFAFFVLIYTGAS